MLEKADVIESQEAGIEDEDLPEPPKSGLTWNLGPRLITLDGDLTLAIHGRLHADAAYFDSGDDTFEPAITIA